MHIFHLVQQTETAILGTSHVIYCQTVSSVPIPGTFHTVDIFAIIAESLQPVTPLYPVSSGLIQIPELYRWLEQTQHSRSGIQSITYIQDANFCLCFASSLEYWHKTCALRLVVGHDCLAVSKLYHSCIKVPKFKTAPA